MAAIAVIKYDSWIEFKTSTNSELFHQSPFQRGVYIFRGQASADWCLEPSFDRCFGELDQAERLSTSKELLKLFRKECEGLELPGSFWDDDLTALAFGQHYGLPTRLLDWTESPYIASFFAFSDALSLRFSKEYVAIWCLDTRVTGVWSSDLGVEILDVPAIGNIRLRNQAGNFTLSKTPFKCLEEYVEHCEGNKMALIKFLIPAHEARYALADLDAMRINHSRIYPELTGCALAAKIHVMLSMGMIT